MRRAMPRRRLGRDDLDFETCCFVCDPANERGLGVAFFLDEEAGRVTAAWTPEAAHEGAPGIVHGGAVGAVLDDAMAWAVTMLTGALGLTRRAELEFAHAVRAGEGHAVAAWIEDRSEGRATAAAELRDASDRLCAASRGEFVLIPREQARERFARARGDG